MKPLPGTPEFLRMACRVVWFEAPEVALADPVRLVAYAMAYTVPKKS